MPVHQQTLFDMAPRHIESPPLVRTPDEVYEVRLTVQIDGKTGDMRCSRQVKSAITDELYEWRMDPSPAKVSMVDAWLEQAFDLALETVRYWHAPF